MKYSGPAAGGMGSLFAEAAARTAAVAGERTVSANDNVKLYSEYQSSKSFLQKKKWL